MRAGMTERNGMRMKPRIVEQNTYDWMKTTGTKNKIKDKTKIVVAIICHG